MTPELRLKRFLENSRLPSHDDVCGKFGSYYSLLKTFNDKFNLIGPLSKSDVYDALFCDSLLIPILLQQVRADINGTFVDIGSGGGFPGLPIAIVASGCEHPSSKARANVVLVEPRKKRAQFTKIVANRLKLINSTTYDVRLEDLPLDNLVQSVPKGTDELGTVPFVCFVSKAFQPPAQWIATATDVLGRMEIGDVEKYIAILHTDAYLDEIDEALLGTAGVSPELTDKFAGGYECPGGEDDGAAPNRLASNIGDGQQKAPTFTPKIVAQITDTEVLGLQPRVPNRCATLLALKKQGLTPEIQGQTTIEC